MRRIILASNSPRRKVLLKQLIGNNFEVIVGNYQENSDIKDPIKLVLHNAIEKASSVKEKGIVIAADTIVVLKNEIIGKPLNKEDAIKMLRKISGKEIDVMTGIVVIDANNNKLLQDYEITKVKMKKLSEKEIKDYVNSEEPLDKAGAFGIQEKGAIFVEKIEGCYFNVTGLPLFKLNKLLNKLGICIFDLS